MKKIFSFIKTFIQMYTEKRIPQASAAMSYFFTLTVFPVIICLYTMLGKNYLLALRALDFLGNFIAAETIEYLKSFLNYIANNSSPAMMIAGILMIVTFASAGVRTLQNTIGDMQGGRRFQGISFIPISILLSFSFVAALYFGIMAMVTGNELIAFVDRHLPFIDISPSWVWFRFLLFFGIELVMISGLYLVSKRRCDNYSVFPGAILAAVALAAISWFFSVIISASARYPLVYGSLASVILLMFWLYMCSMAVFCGAAFNIVLNNTKPSDFR